MKKTPVVMLEFNELCPSLMTEFIEQGHLPNFKKLRDSSATFVSEAKERAPYLEPWIQWINVHTGVPYSEHGVMHLGESDKVKVPGIWDVISDAGGKVWICGSMNVHCTSQVKGDLLPDPWTPEEYTRPAKLLTYTHFIRKQVQEHSNANAKFAKSDYIKFMMFMLKHGLKLSTIKAAINQLRSERKDGKRWRRAFILDLLQYDIFEHFYTTAKPDFSTFFLNSTAHMQHCYWRNMQPEVFQIKPTEKEQEIYSKAILEGYIHMDKLVERVLNLVGPDATVIFLTALSQQPFLNYEEKGGKHIYRPKDIPAFAAWAGIKNLKASNPVMSEQFWLEFHNHDEVNAAADILEQITVDGVQAFRCIREETALFTGFAIRSKMPKDAVMTSPASGQSTNFFNQLYAIEGIKSGMHHPDGLFWVRDKRVSKSSNPRVPVEAIAPTVLDMLDIEIPPSMKEAPLLRPASKPRAAEPELVPA